MFWHTQPEHYNQDSSGSYLRDLTSALQRENDVLARPIFKQEEPQLSPENEARLPPLQCAAAVRVVCRHNRKLGDFQDLNTKYVKSIIQVVFHDRRLQYTEHQQLEGWRRSRPGTESWTLIFHRLLVSLDPRASPTQLNAVEFLWDPSKRASAFIQGVPFRVQIDTFKQNENGEYTEHWHSASCQIKVFKPKGADRKQKTDWEKMEKRTAQEKEKYQPSYETTILTECSPWPDMAYQVNSAPSPSYNGSPNSFGLGEGVSPVRALPLLSLWLELGYALGIGLGVSFRVRVRFSVRIRIFVRFRGLALVSGSVSVSGLALGVRVRVRVMVSVRIRVSVRVHVCFSVRFRDRVRVRVRFRDRVRGYLLGLEFRVRISVRVRVRSRLGSVSGSPSGFSVSVSVSVHVCFILGYGLVLVLGLGYSLGLEFRVRVSVRFRVR
ncbi:unnamed protein product [Nyctereutes procyonoides]|uniref:(raccoon dog) hypothetical protein n=1 Tax=Nyctereutes procyonoides TaxID=34880 RepID=A0A811YS06_NYCPR|nr:unnamed protein product [Nyctereutes procyonoides]